MIVDAIKTAIEGKDLPFDIAKEAMAEIMRGEATNAQMAAFLTALKIKGESISEITACASVMRERSAKLCHDGTVLDIVGTGGDNAHTFNISTVSAFVIAAAGVRVAKHGNRGVSSRCGAADFLEALGVPLELTPEQSARVLAQTNICFMFAPGYHQSMKYSAPVRRELGVRTIFNILGPLSNPAGATQQLLGVYDKKLVRPLAEVLNNLGVARALVVCGEDGLDEISMSANTIVCEVDNGTFRNYIIDPRELGFSLCNASELTGGGPKENAEIAYKILGGEKGPRRDAVALNSAACLYIAGKAESLSDAVKLSCGIIDSGKALMKMREFISVSNEVQNDT